MHHWPHAPPHRLLEKGTYMVTGATNDKVLYFNTPERLQFLHDALLKLAKQYSWELQAWAVFANHYHFIAQSPENPKSLSAFISNLHVATAKYINAQDNTPARNVWWQFWDSNLTYQYSYLSRLNYVNQNPVRHGFVDVSTHYHGVQPGWFQQNTPVSFIKTVASFKIDKLNIKDDF